MSEVYWKVGGLYKTKGGLFALVTKIKNRYVPKNIDWESLNNIMNSDFYEIEGYVYGSEGKSSRVRSSWTISGKHSLRPEADDLGDLTEEEAEWNPQ